jgi:uncharacterized protein involved in exopolysaccharide biosynthesis
MNNTTDNNLVLPPDENEISLVELANAVLRNWRVLAILPFLLVLVVTAWTFTRDRTYAATASFVPQTEGRAATGASTLAQQFGVNLGTERPGQSPHFYVGLLQSRTLLRQIVEAEYQIPVGDGRIWRGTLVDYWELGDRGAQRAPERRATEILRRAISTSVVRETGVVQLRVSSEHALLAERIAERLLELMNEFNLEVQRARAQEESRFIASRMAEAHAELLAAEDVLQDFLRQNRAFLNSPELVFEHDRLQRQVQMRQEVYTSLLRSQEQARIDAARDVPMFTVIDRPAGSAEPEGRGLVLRGMLALMLGLLLAVFVILVMEVGRRGRETEDPQYREFQGLAREAWDDLRHPGRWVRRGEKAVPAGDR